MGAVLVGVAHAGVLQRWQGKRFRAEPEVLIEAVERAETVEEHWRGLYRLTQALFYIGPEVGRLRPMFRQQVAPCFFRLYRNGEFCANAIANYSSSCHGGAV